MANVSFQKFNKYLENTSADMIPSSLLDGSFNHCFIFPGFCDVHVHFREPGFSYKEDINSGSSAAARGGYTAVCTMPNLNPVPDSLENLNVQLSAIKSKAVINVFPFGSITVGQKGEILSDMPRLAPFVAGFSDDGRGVQNNEIMLIAMQKAKELNKVIVAHCEDNSLLCGGYIHKGEYAKLNGHKGISSESEWKQVERDIQLCKKTGVKYHVCHVSTKESVEIIRKAKKDGVDVTCETAPHYLVLDDSMLIDDGAFKMNPPIRDKQDKIALIEGLIDGTIDMIATDHAPHSAEEKSKGLKGSLMGIVGLETAFPILYTFLVKNNVISMQKLIEVLCDNPRKRFNIGGDTGFSLWDLDNKYTINSAEFLSKGKCSPFVNREVYGKCMATVLNGKVIYCNK